MLLRPPPPALAPEAMAAASCYRWVRSARHLPIVPSRPAIHRLAGRLNRRLRCDKASSSLTVRTCNWSLPVVIHVSCSRLPVVQLLDFVGNALPGAVPGIALAHPSPSGLQLARLWLLRYGIVFPYQTVPMANCCRAPTATQGPTQPEGASSALPLRDSVMPFLPLLCWPYVRRNASTIIMWSVIKVMSPRLCQLCSVAWLKNILTMCLMSTFVLLASLCMTICLHFVRSVNSMLLMVTSGGVSIKVDLLHVYYWLFNTYNFTPFDQHLVLFLKIHK
jgi:hypothetical protein